MQLGYSDRNVYKKNLDALPPGLLRMTNNINTKTQSDNYAFMRKNQRRW